MAAVRRLRFVWGIFGPPPKVLVGLYHYAKYGCNRCSSFENMKVWIFRTFGLKTAICVPKIGVLGEFDPLNGQKYQQKLRNPKRCILAQVASFEPSSTKICQPVWPVGEFSPRKRAQIRKIFVTFYLFAHQKQPVDGFAPNLVLGTSRWHNHL